jgi:hypothetical protein
MTRAFQIQLFVVFAALPSMFADPPRGDEPQIRALQAKAMCVALAAFQAEAPKADLRHYSVWLEMEHGNYHVVFVPDAGPGEEFLVGGETKYGAVRGFVISRRTFKILERHFAK